MKDITIPSYLWNSIIMLNDNERSVLVFKIGMHVIGGQTETVIGTVQVLFDAIIGLNETKPTKKPKPQGSIEDRQKAFAESLKPQVAEFGREMIKDFYEYWTEPNKSGSKFRAETETHWDLHRRLLTWQKRSGNKFAKPEPKTNNLPQNKLL